MKLPELFSGGEPVLALAPMQDVTDWAFWKLMTSYGGADVYFTEYFRVYETSRLDRGILRSITENPTGRPAVAQMMTKNTIAQRRAVLCRETGFSDSLIKFQVK